MENKNEKSKIEESETSILKSTFEEIELLSKYYDERIRKVETERERHIDNEKKGGRIITKGYSGGKPIYNEASLWDAKKSFNSKIEGLKDAKRSSISSLNELIKEKMFSRGIHTTLRGHEEAPKLTHDLSQLVDGIRIARQGSLDNKNQNFWKNVVYAVGSGLYFDNFEAKEVHMPANTRFAYFELFKNFVDIDSIVCNSDGENQNKFMSCPTFYARSNKHDANIRLAYFLKRVELEVNSSDSFFPSKEKREDGKVSTEYLSWKEYETNLLANNFSYDGGKNKGHSVSSLLAKIVDYINFFRGYNSYNYANNIPIIPEDQLKKSNS